jgi:O-succinylbenzoate synthase
VNLEGAIDVLMLKVSPLGGINRSLELAAHHNLPVVVSSALESAVGISYGLRLASSLPQLNYACGLATGALFESDLATIPISSGAMNVSAPEIDDERFQRFAASQERLEWWRNRITEVWKLRRAA